jgi:type II secretory pathway pseudopilin PulG
VTDRSRSGTGRAGPSPASGTSLVELLAVVAIVASVLGIGLPVLTHSVDAKRTLDAAAFLAGQFRLARQRAVLTGRNVAIVFDDVNGQVGWRVCRDGDRDGVSRADVSGGIDTCDGPPRPLSDQFAKVQVGYAPGVPALDGDASAAPLRFGVARMAVFTPLGTSSSGSVVLRGEGIAQSAVRVAGATGRTRVVRFDSGRHAWVE